MKVVMVSAPNDVPVRIGGGTITMTTTGSNPEPGFFATLWDRTATAFWENYGRVLGAFFIGLTTWALVWMTAWMGALPQPTPKMVVAPPSVATPPQTDPEMLARMSAIEAALKALQQTAPAVTRKK